MRFLTPKQCAAWSSKRGYPLKQYEGRVLGPDPCLTYPKFHFVEFPSPEESGRKVWLARLLYSFLEHSPEVLIWVNDWGVWEEHMPLFARFRQAFGESRHLIDAPGHIVRPDEIDDGISVFVIACLFLWDCHVLSASGRDALFTSHDEYGWFASRDMSLTRSIRKRLVQGKLKLRNCRKHPA